MAYSTPLNCYIGRKPNGKCETNVPVANGRCAHLTAESMSRREFGQLPKVKCNRCGHVCGVICPDCKRWY